MLYFDLQWLLFFEPDDESFLSMKPFEFATENFGNSPWLHLYEYAIVHKLMMFVIKKNCAQQVISTALELCEYSLLRKKNVDEASIFWSIALIFASKHEVPSFNVNNLFEISKAEIEDFPYIVFKNPFKDFSINEAWLSTSMTLLPLTSETTKSLTIKTGLNYFPLVFYGKFVNSIISFSKGNAKFTIKVDDSLLVGIERRVSIEEILPSSLLYSTNLIFFSIRSNYNMDESSVHLQVSGSQVSIDSSCLLSTGTIDKNSMKLIPQPIQQIEVKSLGEEYVLWIPGLKGLEEVFLLGVTLQSNRDVHSRGSLTQTLHIAIMDRKKEEIELATKSLEITIPNHIQLEYTTWPFAASEGILQLSVLPSEPIHIEKVSLNLKDAKWLGQEERMLQPNIESRYLARLRNYQPHLEGTTEITYKYLKPLFYQGLASEMKEHFQSHISKIESSEVLLCEKYVAKSKPESSIHISYENIGKVHLEIGELFTMKVGIEIKELMDCDLIYDINDKSQWAILGRSRVQIHLKDGPHFKVTVKAIAIKYGRVQIPKIQIEKLVKVGGASPLHISETGGTQQVSVSPRKIVMATPQNIAEF